MFVGGSGVKRGKDYDARLRFSREWGVMLCKVSQAVCSCICSKRGDVEYWLRRRDNETFFSFLRFVAC